MHVQSFIVYSVSIYIGPVTGTLKCQTLHVDLIKVDWWVNIIVIVKKQSNSYLL